MVDIANSTVPVLHIITRLIVGGAQENTMYSAALLDKDRYSVSILSGPQTGSEGSLIEEVYGYDIPLTIIPELVREINPFKDLLAFINIYKFLRQNKFTIVHTHSSKAGILGRIAAKIANIPIIIHTVHGWSFHDYMNPFIRKTYIALERLCARFTDRLIVVGNCDLTRGIQAKIGKISQYTLIRSSIPLDKFKYDEKSRSLIREQLGILPEALVLGNIGRFSHQKNPLDWIKIAGLVASKIPDCYFLMVGDGPLMERAKNLIINLRFQDRFILPGLRRDVASMLSVMDVFLLTSLWEGLPRVLPQAMLIKLPIVAYSGNGSDEVVIPGENGYLCAPGDIQTAAGYILDLLKEPDKRSIMGKKGNALAVEEFSLKQMITQIDNLYQNLLREKYQ